MCLAFYIYDRLRCEAKGWIKRVTGRGMSGTFRLAVPYRPSPRELWGEWYEEEEEEEDEPKPKRKKKPAKQGIQLIADGRHVPQILFEKTHEKNLFFKNCIVSPESSDEEESEDEYSGLEDSEEEDDEPVYVPRKGPRGAPKVRKNPPPKPKKKAAPGKNTLCMFIKATQSLLCFVIFRSHSPMVVS